jgi:hypothetical protein
LIVFCKLLLLKSKDKADKDPYYHTNISIFSFTWADLAAFHKSDKRLFKVNYLLAEVECPVCPKKNWPILLAGGRFLGILGSLWDHPRGCSSVSRGAHGRPGKKRWFSDFGLYPLVHREFPKAESGKSFVSSPTSKDILFLLCGW